MIRELMAVVGVGVAIAVVNPSAQSNGRGSARKSLNAPPATMSLRISVRDQAGASLDGARLFLSGAIGGEFTTGVAGTAVIPNLKAGVYRVRCERDGFVTLEREFTLQGGAWNPIDLAMNAAPPPPSAPPPPPPPPVASIPATGPPITISIPDFLDRDLIRREAFKESILACTPLETVRLLQMRVGIAPHVHDRVDEIVYVVAGEGAVRIGGETTAIRPGSLVFVPNSTDHAFESRGKNPLIVVSTLAGSACKRTETTP